jgi:hypothetical protein
VERPVTQDASVVDHDVDLAEGVERSLDHPLAAFERRHVVVVGYGLSTGARNLGDHGVGHRRARTRPVPVSAEVVDDDPGALLSEQQRVLATETAPSSSDDDDSALDSSHSHPCLRVACRARARQLKQF